MQPPAQQTSPPATTMYMPPQQAMMGGGLFSLHKFLMIGVILILIAGLVSVLPDFSGPPAAIDYDPTDEDYITKIAEDTESHNDFVRLMDTFAGIIGMVGVGLIGYAFVRSLRRGYNNTCSSNHVADSGNHHAVATDRFRIQSQCLTLISSSDSSSLLRRYASW